MNFHGLDNYLSTGEFAPCGPGVDPDQPDDCNKTFATITITGATADADGLATVTFTVVGADGDPITTFNPATAGWKSDLQFAIVALEPAASVGTAYNRWVPYIVTKIEVGSAGEWPNPVGTFDYMGTREDMERTGSFDMSNAGTGEYTYTFNVDLDNVLLDIGGDPILDAGGVAITTPYRTYDRTWTHRVAVWTGGHEGPTAAATYDFRPSDGATTGIETRDIVETETCQQCHGEYEFHGHGGDRLSVGDCNMCHNQSYKSPYNDESLGMAVMIHKIHAGGALATIPGADGIVWDNPATSVDESADNGAYKIYRNFRGTVRTYEWWKVEFPAVIENCTKCHQGSGADVDNWKTKPSRDVCGSCHDDIDWATGANHAGGAQGSDVTCTACHGSTGTISPPIQYPIPAAHDWTQMDVRNIPEFTSELTVSAPANGTHFVAGEAPVVTIILSENGAPIDHTTMVVDTDGAEGCVSDPCPPRDNMFATRNFFVHGPRAKRAAVLTTTARQSGIVGTASATYDLSAAAGGSLDMVVDNGEVIRVPLSNGGHTGNISVDFDAAAFGDVAAATAQEIVDWLNDDTDFGRRAIAYLDEVSGAPAIRSRNLGSFFALRLEAGAVTTAVFAGDTSDNILSGYYPSNNLATDPKATITAGSITYQLDPVDDLVAGTYIASFELSDRGRVNGTNYQTPTVNKVTFQVKQADEELPPAGACDRCHQGPDGRGFILDFARHNKQFDANAIDQCGACHDTLNRAVTGEWAGAEAIARRVHGVHNGANLNFPLETVGYSNGDPVAGRNWDITFPMNIRSCEACHPEATTSGSWAEKPARLPCMGCHDSTEALAHFRLNTWDPTPADPWNGDEAESCKVCHAP